jgi:hypothetical protein
MAVFGRKIELYVGGKDSSTLADLSELHIDFSVSSGEGVDTTGVVSVFNLSRSIVNTLSKGGVIQLSAGHVYDNEVRELFNGEIISIDPNPIGADTMYTMQCTGSTANKFKIVLNVYPPSVSALTIIKDLSKSIGMPIDIDEQTAAAAGLNTKKYPGGLTVYGSALKTIRQICADANLEVIIDDLSIRIVDALKGDLSRVVSLTLDTGLLERLQHAKNKNEPNKITYKFKSILFPELRRGRKIFIDDGSVSGVFKVLTVEHKGSNYNKDYYSIGEVSE